MKYRYTVIGVKATFVREGIVAKQTADLIIENIGELVTCAGPADGRRGDALQTLEIVKDGAIAVTGGLISGVGTTQDVAASFDSANRIDATGRLVTPGLVDPHSHLVHSGSRHDEWEFKVTGRAAAASLQGYFTQLSPPTMGM